MLTWWWSPHICKMVRKQPVFGKGIPSGYSFHGGFVCRNLSTPFRCFFVPKVKEGNIQKNLVCLGHPFSQRHALLHKGSVIQGKGDSYRFVVSPPVWTHIFDDEMQLQLMHSWIHVHFVKPRPKPTSTGSFLDTYTTDCHILWISRVWCKMVFLLDSHGCSSRPNHPNLIFEQLSRNSQSTPFEVLNKPTVTGVTQKNVYKILSHIYIYIDIFSTKHRFSNTSDAKWHRYPQVLAVELLHMPLGPLPNVLTHSRRNPNDTSAQRRIDRVNIQQWTCPMADENSVMSYLCVWNKVKIWRHREMRSIYHL